MTLGEVCEVRNGATPDTNVASYWDGPHAWVTPAEMGGLDSPYVLTTRRTLTDQGLAACSASLAPEKSVILSARAPIGHLIINEVPMATNQGCKTLVPRSGLDYKYLYYFLKANVPLLESLGTGATFRELSAGKLKEVTIPVPPLAEQQRIVAKLDEVDAGLRALSERLDAEMLRSAQVRLGVVDELFASASGTPTALGELLEIQNGYAFESEHFSPSAPIGLIRIRDLKRGTATETGYEGTYDPAYLVKAGDLLIGMDGEFRCYTWKGAPALLNQRVCRLHKFREDVDPRFVLHGINTHLAQIEAETGFTTVKHLSSRTIKEISFDLPALAEQQRIVAKVEEVQSACVDISANIERRRAKAGELRQSVLAAAFRGDL